MALLGIQCGSEGQRATDSNANSKAFCGEEFNKTTLPSSDYYKNTIFTISAL